MLARLDDSFNRTREFTLHASHELKTPLTILCGETETALRDESLSPAERERAASLLDELRRLTRIVDGLTLLAKADAGQVALKLEPVRLDELVRDNFADAQILAEPQGIQVELAACEEITVRGDRHRLRQLLLNLADNAVKYNQPQGWVIMSLRRAGDTAEFAITNSGLGIPPEILPRVFDRFFRGDPAHSPAVDGCGLGLSIVQWIVSAHGGSVQNRIRAVENHHRYSPPTAGAGKQTSIMKTNINPTSVFQRRRTWQTHSLLVPAVYSGSRCPGQLCPVPSAAHFVCPNRRRVRQSLAHQRGILVTKLY